MTSDGHSSTTPEEHGNVHTDTARQHRWWTTNQPMKIKLIDFGLACHVSESDWGISASPLAYRAPENILGFPVTPALDMWALGCVAAELFTGNLLYLGHSEYAMLRYMVQSQGQLPQRLLKDGINQSEASLSPVGRGTQGRIEDRENFVIC
ncbi:homeodomain-interacting protein kinase 1-like [Larimichthys crocea]|uniref:homeodomain-interacting protein kinase 1-like n=1 Tax=Larimichthys crocea TaxID=215358 RepID=UPI000F5F90D2|nr:homeodomain-interacting protein kinase 1-like [Larimichthys crocea]